MELKYGDTTTYKYSLNSEQMEFITKFSNRSRNQTNFLFQLVDGDFEKLKMLECKMKNCFYNACPGDKKTVDMIFNLESRTNFFIL